MDALFAKVLGLSAAACWVIALVLVARLLLRRAPRRFVCLLWAVVLFRLLCPVTFSSPVSLLPRQTLEVEPVPYGQYVTLPAAAGAALRAIGDAANGGLGTITVYLEEPQAAQVDENGIADDPETFPHGAVIHDDRGYTVAFHGEVWLLLWARLWLPGAGILLAAGVISLLRLRRRLVGSVRLEDNVWLCDYIGTAFVLGVFRPRIYLPSGLEDAERGYILLHERTHIRRGDHIWRLLAFAALCVHWFNPLAWAAFHLAVKDLEMACDEAVLRRAGGDIRQAYSASLLRLTTGRRLRFGIPLAFGEGDPKGRIKNVLRYKHPALWAGIAAGVVVAALTLGLAANPARGEQGRTGPPQPTVSTESLPPEETTAAWTLESWEDGEPRDMGGYLLRVETQVDGGRTLTLALHGRYDGVSYGVRQIDVYDGDTLLQSIQALDAIQTHWPEQEDPYTNAWDRDGNLALTDMNFDGTADIGLMAWIPAGANVPFYYWLWSPERGQFEYAFLLCNARPAPESRRIICDELRDGFGVYATEYYEYDGDGVLRLVERETVDYTARTTTTEYYGYDQNGTRLLLDQKIVYDIEEDRAA